eukprot:TRINITY_DN4877_c0_g1_i1.p2 TRINITY_DN4877_c0_g1~~TRINITY_DN4877_c0_g1_i1.p2  ORF type:complete len:171 (+),score=5.56 TRINITY_DN4877_c0_g1_i1:618-1130(+)
MTNYIWKISARWEYKESGHWSNTKCTSGCSKLPSWWKPGEVVGFGFYTISHHQHTKTFKTCNGRFIGDCLPISSYRDDKDSPMDHRITVESGHRVALNLGGAPFAFDLSTLRSPSVAEPPMRVPCTPKPRRVRDFVCRPAGLSNLPFCFAFGAFCFGFLNSLPSFPCPFF